MTPQELNAAVARVADTPGTNITAAEVARVLACEWAEIAKLPTVEAMQLIAARLATARAKIQDAAFSDAPHEG